MAGMLQNTYFVASLKDLGERLLSGLGRLLVGWADVLEGRIERAVPEGLPNHERITPDRPGALHMYVLGSVGVAASREAQQPWQSP